MIGIDGFVEMRVNGSLVSSGKNLVLNQGKELIQRAISYNPESAIIILGTNFIAGDSGATAQEDQTWIVGNEIPLNFSLPPSTFVNSTTDFSYVVTHDFTDYQDTVSIPIKELVFAYGSAASAFLAFSRFLVEDVILEQGDDLQILWRLKFGAV